MSVMQTEAVPGLATHVVGEGAPVTVFAHGLGGDSSETRMLAARAPGTRVLLDFRGHGESAALPGGWDYDLLADDLARVAGAYAATRAVGLSLGGGALLRLLTRDPHRFDRLAFVLPASLDASRADAAAERMRGLGRAIDAGDADIVRDILLDEVPAELRTRRGAQALVARRAARLVQRPAPVPLRDDRPLPDRAALATFTAPTLVVGQPDDPLHPLAIATELAGALPHARLRTVAAGGVFWTASREVQAALADHLGASA